MRMYLSAKSSKGVGYTPDWLRITCKNGEDITFDIRGEIDYDSTSLNCRVKGYLDPWVTYTDEGDEIDLSNLSNEELTLRYPPSKILDMLLNATNYEIGICPVNNCDAKDDKISSGEGEILYCVDGEEYKINFCFKTEIMDY